MPFCIYRVHVVCILLSRSMLNFVTCSKPEQYTTTPSARPMRMWYTLKVKVESSEDHLGTLA